MADDKPIRRRRHGGTQHRVGYHNVPSRHVETTREQKIERGKAFTRHRIDTYYAYLEGRLPSAAKVLRDVPIDAIKLTGPQQVDLGRLIQAGLVAKMVLSHLDEDYLNEIGVKIDPKEYEVPSSSEKQTEEVLAIIDDDGKIDVHHPDRRTIRRNIRISEDGDEARRVFIMKNLGLVTMISRREMRKRGFDEYTYAEVEEEAKIGMISAVDRFDPDAGFKFSTYATWWIQQKIWEYLNAKTKLIKMPSNMNTLYRRIAVATKELRMEYSSDAEITPERLCEWMTRENPDWGVTAEQIEDAQRMRKEVISLDTPVGDDGDKSIEGTVPSNDDLEYDVLSEMHSRESVDALLSVISDDRNRAIMTDFYENEARADNGAISRIARKYGITTKEVKQRLEAARREIVRVVGFGGREHEFDEGLPPSM